MPRFITAATLAEVIRLRRELHEAQVRTNAGCPIRCDLGTFEEPVPLSREENAFWEFLHALPMDVLRELQALYWLGLPQTTRASLRTRLKHQLKYSWSNDDRIPQYFYAKNIHLAEALERAQQLLGW